MIFVKSQTQPLPGNSDDPRVGGRVIVTTPELEESMVNDKDSWILVGYPDDEGIGRVGGRKGASLAPETIRKYLYKMTPSIFSQSDAQIYDLGNLSLESPYEERRQHAKHFAQTYSSKGFRWIGLGGGHDWGYVDGWAFLKTHPDGIVINFDAHLDVRPTNNGSNSGTAFRELVTEFNGFTFYEIGLQEQCNSRQHHQWLMSQGAKTLFYEEMLLSSRPHHETILSFLDSDLLKSRPTYISLDIDVFSNAWAPGCSQSFATGFDPESFLRVLAVLKKRLDIRSFGIYEVSPKLDVDDRTSKLAALILHRLIF